MSFSAHLHYLKHVFHPVTFACGGTGWRLYCGFYRGRGKESIHERRRVDGLDLRKTHVHLRRLEAVENNARQREPEYQWQLIVRVTES